MRTILITGLRTESAAETVCALLRLIPQPCSLMIVRGFGGAASSAWLRFDTRDEAAAALRGLRGACPEGVSATLARPIESDFEFA